MKQKEVSILEKKVGWNKTSVKKILSFLKKDAIEIKENNTDHKIIDILFEIIQLANRKRINLDKALEKHLKEMEKKYKLKII